MITTEIIRRFIFECPGPRVAPTSEMLLRRLYRELVGDSDVVPDGAALADLQANLARLGYLMVAAPSFDIEGKLVGHAAAYRFPGPR